MIKEDLTKGQLVSGSGRVYRFDSTVYLTAAKFLMKKFNLNIAQAKGQLNYYIVSAHVWKNGKPVDQFFNDKKSTNARLNNIVKLDYEWNELFYA